ncbi:hypothetical protein AB6C74_08755 [Vibrio splendidus]
MDDKKINQFIGQAYDEFTKKNGSLSVNLSIHRLNDQHSFTHNIDDLEFRTCLNECIHRKWIEAKQISWQFDYYLTEEGYKKGMFYKDLVKYCLTYQKSGTIVSGIAAISAIFGGLKLFFG